MKKDNTRTDGKDNQDAPQQVLTFSLGPEVYGVDILRVKEIRGWTPVTRMPQSPACMLGVLNLRGTIVPVMDLRLRFALPAAEFTPKTVIIVLSLHSPQGVRECGVVADDVRDVVDIAPDSVRPAPEMTGGSPGPFVRGIVALAHEMLILLDVDELTQRELAPDTATSTAA